MAAKRVEELQAVVGKIAEESASGNDSPVGIPPQRAKPAGVKPDPKARPFTPGRALSAQTVFTKIGWTLESLRANFRNTSTDV